jgi:Fe-S cluster assembly protein SufD
MTQVADKHMATSSWFGTLPQGDDSWLDDLRRTGAERFAVVGFPSTKSEEWRFTQLAPIIKTQFRPAKRESASRTLSTAFDDVSLGAEASAEIVFVNGFYDPQLSRPGELTGVRVCSLGEALKTDPHFVRPHLGKFATVDSNPFVALNTGALRDAAFIHVARGAAVEQPIHVLFLSTPAQDPAAAHPRVLVVLEAGASATLVESYSSVGDGVYFNNAVTEVVAGPDARLDHYKLQQESKQAYHVASMQVQLARGADFVSHSASTGGRITRNDLNVTLAGEHAQATLNGLVLITGEQHVDNHTMLDHAVPNCPSHELYKHVLDGKSTGVFKGKILVRRDAQKTDAKQTSKTLLLSDDAVMNSQPALEIYADDVKCTHGSTIGPVDEEQVFYLRSRGVGHDAARHLMTYAFAADVTRRIKVEAVRRRLENFMAAQHGLPQDLRITDLGAHDEAARNL